MITFEAIDRSGGNYNYEKCEKVQTANILDEISQRFNLIDIWRVKNPEKTRFT